jgi:hypothetical protein
MLPAKADHILVYLAGFSYLKSAEEVGVRFYRYTTGFLHQKVMLIDDDLASVGTANLDNRSLNLNFEQTVFVADKTFAAKVAASQYSDGCFLAIVGDDGESYLSFLDIKHRVSGVSLREDCTLLGETHCLLALANGCEEATRTLAPISPKAPGQSYRATE